ncbi:HNH endonuclease [Pseudonocardia broussonetiae]|uniref:HNH endonuclease n=1 Tax=Pseudonocardia broussonetiae TaxID=2736640 RepID=A0A6M6JIE5_9PSEU|nr:HNH endonuclease [Pseudonocardia broussonetiae]QJY46687.1 HNH endonuclease [Pseudonocardia broussonetiae]
MPLISAHYEPNVPVQGCPSSERYLAEAGAGRDRTECWPWPGGLSSYGYGRFLLERRFRWASVGAHRVSLERHLGRRLLPTEQACHRCDNPSCVNPTHLFVGTNADNCRDMRLKQRQKKKLTDAQVLELRARYAAGGVLQRELGDEYGIGQSYVSTLVRGDWTTGQPRPRR